MLCKATEYSLSRSVKGGGWRCVLASVCVSLVGSRFHHFLCSRALQSMSDIRFFDSQ